MNEVTKANTNINGKITIDTSKAVNEIKKLLSDPNETVESITAKKQEIAKLITVDSQKVT